MYTNKDMMNFENIIIGAGPSALQLGYFFEKNNIEYIILEKEDCCASFFSKFPIANQLISLNKKNTGETNPDFNLRHDWNSLLNDEQFLFTDYSDDLYPNSDQLFNYLNDFSKKFNLKIEFGVNVQKINKNNLNYEIKTNSKIYTCKKLIMATGLSVKNFPKNIMIQEGVKIKHYGDINKTEFMTEIEKYRNKKVILIGGGNASYELANILDKYCSTVVIVGSNKKLSIVSHYVGDIRTIYLPFLDGFYLKSLNGIDSFERNIQYTITKNTDILSEFYNKYRITDAFNNDYYGKKLTYVDDIIFCTGWTFDNSIFNFKVKTTNNDKYPLINELYESENNTNLYFIGSLMHSLDFKRGSGGFIHGFRYLIKFFTQINYNLPLNIKYFSFKGDMSCYDELTKHIFDRINYASSIYQLYGTLCDIFYFDKKTKKIVYVHDWKLSCKDYLKIDNEYINCVSLHYGEEEEQINKLGRFIKHNPSFLHPKIHTILCKNNNVNIIDTITFEEDLIADFSSIKIYDKIYQTLKMCNLII